MVSDAYRDNGVLQTGDESVPELAPPAERPRPPVEYRRSGARPAPAPRHRAAKPAPNAVLPSERPSRPQGKPSTKPPQMANRPPSLLTEPRHRPAPSVPSADDGDWFADSADEGFPTSESPAVGYRPEGSTTAAITPADALFADAPPTDAPPTDALFADARPMTEQPLNGMPVNGLPAEAPLSDRSHGFGRDAFDATSPRTAPAFDGVLDAVPAVTEDGPPMSKRAARLLLCLAVLAAGGFAVSARTDGFFPSLFDRTDETATAQRVEVAAGPTTTEAASSPITRALPQVRALLATPDGGTGMEDRYFSGSPADSQDGFAGAIGSVLGGDDSAPSEPTEWVEPDLGPESEWVDSGNGVMVPDLQLRIRFCESTNNYAAANGGSSARGAYQFLFKSWDWYGHAAVTGVTEAHLATPAQQDEAALRTLRAEGARPWAESRPCWGDPDLDPRYATAKPPTPAPTTAPSTTEPTTESTSESTTETTAESTTTSEQSESTDTTAESTTTETTAESTTSSEAPPSTDSTTSSSTDTSST